MRFQALTEEERTRIHEGALEILESIGLQLPSASLLAQLKEQGLEVLADQRLRLSRSLVESALRCAPRSVCLGARGAGRTVLLDGTRTFAATDGCGSKALDLDTGLRRPSALQDLAASARLTDALEEFHVYWTMVSAQDVPPSERVAREFLTALQNTLKHVQIIDVGQPAEAEALVRMGQVLSDAGIVEESPVSMLISVVSPLRLDPSGTEAALAFARAGLPVVACSMPIGSVTAPATAAGLVMLAHAELLGFITVLESLFPGAPVIYTSYPVFAHPRTGETNYADPRRGWLAAAAAQLGRWLRIPCFTSGDLLALMAGADLISGGGLLETSTLLALEQLVIDNEALRQLEVLASSQEVCPETLAPDVIRQVGPGGHFLAQRHTLRHVREFLTPKFIEAEAGAGPAPGSHGRDGAREKARQEARRLLKEHSVEPLPAPIVARLEQVVQESAASVTARQRTSGEVTWERHPGA